MGTTPGRTHRPTGSPPIASAVGTVQPPTGTPAPVSQPPQSQPSDSAIIAAVDPSAPGAKTSYLPVAPDPLIDSTIEDRYKITKKLGEGGMGAVYLALHLVLEKQVAIKVLHGEFARKPDLVERFMQEAKAASRIRHENVIDISDYGQTPDGLVFFVMEMLKGHDLHEEITRAKLAGNLLPWTRTKKIFLQVCSALSAAHARGIIHRDLKPENIYLIDFLGEPDFVKLLDFGIAKLTDAAIGEGGESARKLTKTGMLFGTPEYMSPEQARGDKVDHRVDVYAMGCILFQLITNQVPFIAENFMGVLSQHLTADPPQVSPEVLDQIGAPRAISDIIDKTLTKDPDTRWQTIDELANAIREACGDAPMSDKSIAMKAANVAHSGETTRKRTPTATATPVLGVRAKNISGPQRPETDPAASTSGRRRNTAWTGNLSVPEVADEPDNKPGKSKLPLILGAVVLLGAGIAAVVAMGGKSEPAGQGAIAAGSDSGSAALVAAGSGSATVETPPPPPVDTLPATVSIKVDSTPSGALIVDASDDKITYGRTPTSFSIPGSQAPRRFKLVLKGYGDSTVELVPNRADIEFNQPLTKGTKATTAKLPDAPKPVPGTGSAAVVKPDPGTGSAATVKSDPGPGSAAPKPDPQNDPKPDPPKPDPGVQQLGGSGATKPDCPDPDDPCLKSFP